MQMDKKNIYFLIKIYFEKCPEIKKTNVFNLLYGEFSLRSSVSV